MKQSVNILHLSDIHYFIPKGSQENKDTVKRIRDELFKKIVEWSKENVIDIIMITGDLSWSGKTGEYNKLKNEYLSLLVNMLNLKEDIILISCPGNHDLYRNDIQSYSIKAEQIEEKENLLNNDLSLSEKSPFSQYSAFLEYLNLEHIKIPEYKGHSESISAYCSGHVVLKDFGVRIFIVNSSWFAFGSEYWKKICPKDIDFSDRGKLILGKKIVKEVLGDFNKGQDDFIHIGIIHHPPDFLAKSDIIQTGLHSDLPSYIQFANNMHCIFCGHTHHPFSTATLLFNQTQLISGGAALLKNIIKYGAQAYPLRVGLYTIFKDRRKIQEKSIYYYPDSKERKYQWQFSHEEDKIYTLFDNDKHLYEKTVKNILNDNRFDQEIINDFYHFPIKDCNGIDFKSFNWKKYFNNIHELDYDCHLNGNVIELTTENELRVLFNCKLSDFDLSLVKKYLGDPRKLIINLIEFEHKIFTPEELIENPSIYPDRLFRREVAFNKLKNSFEEEFGYVRKSLVYKCLHREEALKYKK
jgi:hypothetical protein